MRIIKVVILAFMVVMMFVSVAIWKSMLDLVYFSALAIIAAIGLKEQK